MIVMKCYILSAVNAEHSRSRHSHLSFSENSTNHISGKDRSVGSSSAGVPGIHDVMCSYWNGSCRTPLCPARRLSFLVFCLILLSGDIELNWSSPSLWLLLLPSAVCEVTYPAWFHPKCIDMSINEYDSHCQR